jgi:hypothetical protein
MIKIAAPTPAALVRELEEKTNAEPPPAGYAWSVAWGSGGRRTDLDALVPMRGLVPANATVPAFVLVFPEHSEEWLAATLPDDLAVPGTIDRLSAYLGTPNPERDA